MGQLSQDSPHHEVEAFVLPVLPVVAVCFLLGIH